MVPISREEFEDIALDALENLPEEFSEKLENVALLIEDYPSPQVQAQMRVSQHGLLGLYSGVPHGERSVYYSGLLPDRIYLYQKNIEAICRSPEELTEQIQRTVLHEIGHYFGIDDARLRELGF